MIVIDSFITELQSKKCHYYVIVSNYVSGTTGKKWQGYKEKLEPEEVLSEWQYSHKF